jgi:two-component system, NarL family, response regulator NreC
MHVRIGIVGHFLLVREALADLLTRHPDLAVVGEAACDMETVRLAESWNADILILELLSDRSVGQLMVKELKKQIPKIKILVISQTTAGEHILDLLKAGAVGVCGLSDSFSEVSSAIQHLLSDRYYLSAPALDQVVRTVLAERKTPSSTGTDAALSPRENEILKLISGGYGTKEIANYFCLSKRTVEKHRYNIMKKLNIHRTAALVLYCREKAAEP